MRTTCFVVFALFALFTYFQFNDLDQYETRLWFLWVALYAITSGFSLVSAFYPLPRLIYSSLAFITIMGSVYRAFDISSGQPVFYNENNPAGNEAGGLMLVGLWFAFLAWKHLETPYEGG